MADQVLTHEAEYRGLTAQQLLAKSAEFKKRLADGEPVASVLPEAFAALREASDRAQAHRHFHCQLIGGQVLYEGNVAEMKTGEGKTIVCHLAAYMKFCQGKKVHIVTVNDYLVKRDAEFARPIFALLGATVGYIQAQLDPGGNEGPRQQAYACDITYGTNSEFGFDYLRDNMKTRKEDQVQGRLDFAIVDEVDSILIDEARTPLIISGPAHDDVSRYKWADALARSLVPQAAGPQQGDRTAHRRRMGGRSESPGGPQEEPEVRRRHQAVPRRSQDAHRGRGGGDPAYTVLRRAGGPQAGAPHARRRAGRPGRGGHRQLLRRREHGVPHLIENALRAHVVYERDKEYVVQDRQVIIVDEFTGRLMHGRQWSDGLHQAVEAKENVPVKEERRRMATITIQNFFKLYEASPA